MQIRGGLLIEPWKAFKFYTDVPREQSIVSYDDLLYVCSVAHQAGATFAENLDKFVAVGSGQGGGGSGGNRYVGEWDLNFGGYATLVEAFPDPTKSTGFSTISNNIFQYLGDNAPIPLGPNFFYDYVVAEGASSIDSGIRSMKVNIPSTFETNCNIFYGVINNNNTIDDLMRVINGDIGLTVSGILFIAGVSIDGFLVYCYVINNGVLGAENLWGTRILSPVADEPIYIDLNTATGSFSISITGEPNRIEQVIPETLPSTGNTFISPSILDLSNLSISSINRRLNYL